MVQPMISPVFFPRQTIEDPNGGPSVTVWVAEVMQGVRLHLIPEATGHEIIVTEPCSTGESYGVFPSLEVAYLESCVIFADILEANS
jgi:hypothetical protein